MSIKPILVFIDGPAPTDADKALFAEVNANQFVNSQLHGSSIIPHTQAFAVETAWIPEGYTTEVTEVETQAPAPLQNPAAPPQAPQSGTLGIQAGDGQPVAPDMPILPMFGQQSKGN